MSKIPKASKLKPPFARTDIPGGIDKVIRIWRDLRKRNSDGYVPGGGHLANVRDHGGVAVSPGTTCSPFTACVIGVAFDPTYPREDLPVKGGDPYVPMFNGGNDKLPFLDFYHQHNNDNEPVPSLEYYNIGREIDPTEMRRGDVLGIDWNDAKHHGHAVFCWDVHLNDEGKVDCFQYLGANSSPGLCGVTIGGCATPKWLTGKPKSGKTAGTLAPVEPIFEDSDEIVQHGQWLALPGVKKVDESTFRALPVKILYPKANTWTVNKVRVGRLHYAGDPPDPYCMKKAGEKPKTPPKPGHVDAPATTVKGQNVRSDPEVPRRVPTKPVQQDKDKPTNWQYGVEVALNDFYTAGWIDVDPGKPDNVNDGKSQDAVRDFQKKFKLDVDGIAGPITRGVLKKQLPACHNQKKVQEQLGRLFRGNKLMSDPGSITGTNNAKTRDAVMEFQRMNQLDPTGIPDAETQAKLQDVIDGHEPTAAAPGLEPEIRHLYWLGNTVAPGGSQTLRLHSRDLVRGQECTIHLTDRVGKKEADATVTMSVSADTNEVAVPIPAEFGVGAEVLAKVTAALSGEGELEANTKEPLYVRGATTEPADWRPYIRNGEIPADVLEKVKNNRAKYPAKTLPPSHGGPKNNPHLYEGPHKYDYAPKHMPKAYVTWTKGFVKKKIDEAPEGKKAAAKAFMVFLSAEGYPASVQTYDGQIVTWGVGFGGKGNGVHIFENLNKDPKMKELLDSIGINYGDWDYHVVDLRKKEVVSSVLANPHPKKGEKGGKGDDNRHIVALEAWRQQPDLLSAIIGLTEDPATREKVAEAQYALYLSHSASWGGQDKVYSGALFFMICHLYAWLPAIAKYGFDVNKEFAAIGGGTPSADTDTKLGARIIKAFARKLKAVFEKSDSYADLHDRTKSHVWAKFRKDAKDEGFDPGDVDIDA